MTLTAFRPRRRALVAAAAALPLTALAACSSDTGEGPSLGGDDGEEGGGTSDGGADTSAYADVIASGPVADDDAVAASEWASAIKERGELIRGGTTANQVFSLIDRKSTRLNSSHVAISYAVFCLKKKNHTR